MRQANRKDGGYTTSKKAEWLTKLSHQGKWQDDTNGHNDNQIVAIQEPLTLSKKKKERERENRR